MVTKNTPLASEYPIANSFAPGWTSGFTGPMPVRIIAAFSVASSQGRPSSQW